MKRVKICFLLALTILFWCLGEISEKDVYAADQKKQGIDVILIIDQSGSMGWKERDPERRALNMADFFVKKSSRYGSSAGSIQFCYGCT